MRASFLTGAITVLMILGCKGGGGSSSGDEEQDGDGASVLQGDCDDTDPAIGPGIAEVCDGVDQNCNGTIDDAPTDGQTYFVDDDGDGYGDPDRYVDACAVPVGYADNADDCDDSNPDANPDGVDDGQSDLNCDGEVTGGGPSIDLTWSSSGVVVNITGDGSKYDFGMAETASGDVGWYGEDCYKGTGAYLICHTLPAGKTTLKNVSSPSSVDNTHTLFKDAYADGLTYFLYDWDNDTCWIWGDDPSYYASFVSQYGCSTGQP